MDQPLIGIIVAMQEELEVVLQALTRTSSRLQAGMLFHQGYYADRPVVVVISGVGKVNAALCTQILISDYHVQRVINIGVAGGLGPHIVPGDIVIADTLVQHDMDLRPLGLAQGQLYRMDLFDFKADPTLVQLALQACATIQDHAHFVGRIVTGDQFIADPTKAKQLHEDFNALACEMESASIAHVCHVNAVPFVCIRSISDNANTGAHIDFTAFTSIAVANASALLATMIPLCDVSVPALS